MVFEQLIIDFRGTLLSGKASENKKSSRISSDSVDQNHLNFLGFDPSALQRDSHPRSSLAETMPVAKEGK